MVPVACVGSTYIHFSVNTECRLRDNRNKLPHAHISKIPGEEDSHEALCEKLGTYRYGGSESESDTTTRIKS